MKKSVLILLIVLTVLLAGCAPRPPAVHASVVFDGSCHPTVSVSSPFASTNPFLFLGRMASVDFSVSDPETVCDVSIPGLFDFGVSYELPMVNVEFPLRMSLLKTKVERQERPEVGLFESSDRSTSVPGYGLGKDYGGKECPSGMFPTADLASCNLQCATEGGCAYTLVTPSGTCGLCRNPTPVTAGEDSDGEDSPDEGSTEESSAESVDVVDTEVVYAPTPPDIAVPVGPTLQDLINNGTIFISFVRPQALPAVFCTKTRTYFCTITASNGDQSIHFWHEREPSSCPSSRERIDEGRCSANPPSEATGHITLHAP